MVLLVALGFCTPAHAQAPSSCVAGTNVYYIDNVGGSDSNTQTQAKTKAMPWAHAPYMASFTGTYSAGTGDCFFLKGGDTWVYTDWQWIPTISGTSGHPIYIGWGDTTWGTGRPIGQGGAGSGGTGTNKITPQNYFINLFGSTTAHNYITIDNIEFAQLYDDTSSANAGVVNYGTSDNITVTNLYVHAVHHGATARCDSSNFAMFAGNTSTENPNSNISYTVIDGSDWTNGGDCGFGVWGLANVDHSVILSLPDAFLSVGTTTQGCYARDNLIYKINTSFDGTHEDGIFCTGAGTLVNNKAYDCFSGECLSTGLNNSIPSQMVNNLVWCPDSGCSTAAIPGQLDNSGSTTSTATAFIANNTWVVNGASTPCFRVDYYSGISPTLGTFTYQNNHCIAATSQVCYNATGSGCGNATTANVSNNTSMTSAEATTAGMTSSQIYVYSQTTSNCNGITAADCPVGNATNLFSSMTGNLAAGLSDTTYGVTYNVSNHTAVNSGRSTNVRWTSGGSAGGDTGAYLLSGSPPATTTAPCSACFVLLPPTNLKAKLVSVPSPSARKGIKKWLATARIGQ